MNRKKRRTAGVSVFWRALLISSIIHAAVIFLIPSVQVLSPGNGYIELELLPLPPEDDVPAEEGISPDTGETPVTAPTRPTFEQIPTQFQAIAPEAGTLFAAADTILLSEARQPRDVLAENQAKSVVLSSDTLPPPEIKRDWVLPKRQSEPPEIPEILTEPAPPDQQDDVLLAEQRYAEWLQTQTTQFVQTAREPALPEPLLPDVIEQERPSRDLTIALAEPHKRIPETRPTVPVMPESTQAKQSIRPEDEPMPPILSPEPTPGSAGILPVRPEPFQAHTTMRPAIAPRQIAPDTTLLELAQEAAAQPQTILVSPARRVLLAQLPDTSPTPVPQQLQVQPIRPPPALNQTDVRPLEEVPGQISVPALPNPRQQAVTRPALRLPELNDMALPPALQPASGTPVVNPRSLPSTWQSAKRTMPISPGTTDTGSRSGERAPFGMFVDKATRSAQPPEPDVTLNENDAIQQATTREAAAIGDASIEGPAAGRQVTYKPRNFPEIELDAEVDLRLKFWVLPDGTVGEVLPLQRGNVRLEQAAISYLKQWRFNPVTQDAADVWGIIVIRYKLR